MKKSQDRPFKSMNGKTFTESREVLNEQVAAEINERKVSIDRIEFQKTGLERKALKQAKTEFKKNPTRSSESLAIILKAGQRRPRANWKISLNPEIPA